MKTLHNIILSITLCIVLVPMAQAQTSYEPWEIRSFDSTLEIHEDTSFHVSEEITAQFNVSKRGIYREIPISYEDRLGQPYTMHISNIQVFQQDGTPWEFAISKEDRYLNIRIGNAETYLKGEYFYRIEYDVERAFTRQRSSSFVDNPDLVEFFWNTTGTWTVPIGSASQKVIPPTSYNGTPETICFQGYTYSADTTCQDIGKEGEIHFATTGPLALYQQISVGTSFDISQFTMPSTTQEIMWYLSDNYLTPIAGVLALFIIIIWYLKGKELPLGIVIPHWDIPKQISPLEAGTLMDDVVTMKEFSAGIIYLATEGFITIKEHKDKKSYTFTRLRTKEEEEKLLSSGMSTFIQQLFISKTEVTTSHLKDRFYTRIPTVKNAVYEDVTAKQYYLKNPAATQGMYAVAGTLISASGAITALVLSQFTAVLAFIFLAVLWVPLALAMPKKTIKGRTIQRQLLGIKKYIQRAEQYRMNILQSPDKAPQEFERLLPFAMIFGLEEEWAKKFADIYISSPSWFQGTDSTLSSIQMISVLQTLSKTASRAMTTSPAPVSSSSSYSSYSSSGGSSFSGGFSGGGFGGGGGGSW